MDALARIGGDDAERAHLLDLGGEHRQADALGDDDLAAKTIGVELLVAREFTLGRLEVMHRGRDALRHARAERRRLCAVALSTDLDARRSGQAEEQRRPVHGHRDAGGFQPLGDQFGAAIGVFRRLARLRREASTNPRRRTSTGRENPCAAPGPPLIA
jgi:hypothetical protein